MRRKNILILVPRMNIGGAETCAANLARLLKKVGYQVFIASGGGKLAKQMKLEGIPHFFLPIRISTDIAVCFLKRIVDKYHINLIHANSAAAGIVAVKYKMRYKSIPVVFTAHGSIGHNQEEMLLNECDRIICVSNFLYEDSLKKGFDKEKMLVIYNGINLNGFCINNNSGIEVRKQYHIPKNMFVITIVARIKNLHNKGHMDLLELFKKYNTENWHLMVVGKGRALWKLKYYIWKNGLGRKVHCLGHHLNVMNILNGTDVVVLPSYFETFGLALAEGMALGKPAIAYKVGGIPEVIEDGKTGYLIEYKDVNSLYQKLLELKENIRLREKMGIKAKNYVREKFSNEKMLNEIIQIYDKV